MLTRCGSTCKDLSQTGVNRKVVLVILLLVLGAALYWIFRDRGAPSGDPAAWDKDRAFAAVMPVLQETDWKSRERLLFHRSV